MNLRNIGLYLAILLFVVILGVSFQYVSISLLASGRLAFTDTSTAYMVGLVGNVDINNFEAITEDTEEGYQTDNIFLADEDSGETSVTDVLAKLNFDKKLMEKTINPIKIIYNAPSFILTFFDLPISYFSFAKEIINLVFYIGFVFLVIKELK